MNSALQSLIKKADRFIIDGLPSERRYSKALWAELMPLLIPSSDWLPFTMQAYERIPEFASEEINAELFEWERRAITSHFPEPPGRVLVGACGGGREMAGLVRRGYEVAGFDPSAELLESARTRIGAAKRLALEKADFDALIRGLMQIEHHAPYDALILGWGSLAHVGEENERLALLEKLRGLCPRGPLLLSWLKSPEPGSQRLWMRKRLSLIIAERNHARDIYDTHLGFIHLLDQDEIGRLAESTGWRVIHCNESYAGPHAVLR